MKFIVFSFDDGLRDFLDNALDVLEKHNFKASLNIISGYSDMTVNDGYSCLDPAEINFLCKRGFEIANHTDSHLKHASFDELELCNQKLNKWCNINKIHGIVMPKYASPCKSAQEYICQNNPPYVSYEKRNYPLFRNFFNRIYRKIRYVLHKSHINLLKYIISMKMYKKNSTKFIRRLEAGQEVEPRTLYEALNALKNGYCLTIVFHSITDDIDHCPYPKGAWTIKQFNLFCQLLHSDEHISVIIQYDAVAKDKSKIDTSRLSA